MSTHTNPTIEMGDLLDDEIVEPIELELVIETQNQNNTVAQHGAAEHAGLQLLAFLGALKPVAAINLTTCRFCSTQHDATAMVCDTCNEPTGGHDRAVQEAFALQFVEGVLTRFGFAGVSFHTNSRGKLVATIEHAFATESELEDAIMGALNMVETAAGHICGAMEGMERYEAEIANIFALSRTMRAVYHRLTVLDAPFKEAFEKAKAAKAETDRLAAMSAEERQAERDAKRTDKAIKNLAAFTAKHRTLPGASDTRRGPRRNGRPARPASNGESRKDSNQGAGNGEPRRNRNRNRRRTQQGNATAQARPGQVGGVRQPNGESRKDSNQGDRNRNRRNQGNKNHAGGNAGNPNPVRASRRDENGRKRR